MIVVGLGNPGRKYERTRHNIGFMIVDRLVDQLNGTKWKKERGVRWSKVGEHWVVKPQEYMNRSGQVLRDFLQFHHLPQQPEDLTASLTVVHDELDFPEETVKLQHARSSAGHNGVQSIIDAWGGWNGFDRLRFGIGDNRQHNIPAEDYVLQNFPADTLPVVDRQIDGAVGLLEKKLQR